MAFLEWTPDLIVGIKPIDEEHESLVALLNILHAAMTAGADDRRLVEMFDDLMDSIEHEFATEESLFEQCGYP